MAKAELLSPAGNFEKLKSAVLYGADAVYLAGKSFGMRAASGNFTNEELREAVEYCHARNVRVHITINVMPHTFEYEYLKDYILFVNEIGADAVIVADLGVFMMIRELCPKLEIHLSTQASVVSAETCKQWHKLGAKRIVLARELSLNEIREIRENTPDTLELETFIHGAMCIAYSGRCLLSNYFTGRDANHGTCVQSCRWNYAPSDEDKPDYSIDLSEANRPEQRAAVAIDEVNGETFFMSSKDMCMIEHIPELEEAGISSYKIEGRVKSAYYTAVVTNTYRMALDSYRKSPENYTLNPDWLRELDGVSHREYGTGFFFNKPYENAQTVTQLGYIREKAYIATALSSEKLDNGEYRVLFIQRNKLKVNDRCEIISPGKCGRGFDCTAIYDEKMNSVESAPHPSMLFYVDVPFEVKEGDIMRLGDREEEA